MKEKTQIEILYEDAALIVCRKPVGWSSETELPAALAALTGAPALCVHRLDTGVGGIMVYARTKTAAALNRAITEGRFEKNYLAVCAGRPAPEAGEMRDLLFRDRGANKTYVVKRPRKGVREAALRYRVLEAREDCSLAAVRLETGRSHQIRAQFASRAHPLLGDGKYGSRVKSQSIALWAFSLAFPHPVTAERMRFSASPPAEPPWTLFHPPSESRILDALR